MAFATKEDVAKRLKRSLTSAEEDSAAFLLEAAQAVIEEAAERDEAQIIALKGEVPSTLRFVAVELAVRALSNPEGLVSKSESLGAYANTKRYRKDHQGEGAQSELELTPIQERLVRRAVWGRLSGTAQMGSAATDCCVVCGLAPSACFCGCEGS